MTIWEFTTDESTDEYYREVAHDMGNLFGMSFEEAVCRINECYRGRTFLSDPHLQPEMPADEANEIVLGPSWWKDTDERQLRPPPAGYAGVSVADQLNRGRRIPPYPDLYAMSDGELGDYIVSGAYFHVFALGTLLAKLDYCDVGETILRVLMSAPPIVFDKEDGIGFGFIVGELIQHGTESVRMKAWALYDEMSDAEKAATASNYFRIHKTELRRY